MRIRLEKSGDRELAYRDGDTKAFACVIPPRLNGGRLWAVQYRGTKEQEDQTGFRFGPDANVCPKTRQAVIRELETVARLCNEQQLNLNE